MVPLLLFAHARAIRQLLLSCPCQAKRVWHRSNCVTVSVPARVHISSDLLLRLGALQAFWDYYNSNPEQFIHFGNDNSTYFVLLKALLNAMSRGHVWGSTDEVAAFESLVQLYIEDGHRVLRCAGADPFYVSTTCSITSAGLSLPAPL